MVPVGFCAAFLSCRPFAPNAARYNMLRSPCVRGVRRGACAVRALPPRVR